VSGSQNRGRNRKENQAGQVRNMRGTNRAGRTNVYAAAECFSAQTVTAVKRGKSVHVRYGMSKVR